jgi:hypothetical protein
MWVKSLIGSTGALGVTAGVMMKPPMPEITRL